jgi:hypothetical protein
MKRFNITAPLAALMILASLAFTLGSCSSPLTENHAAPASAGFGTVRVSLGTGQSAARTAIPVPTLAYFTGGYTYAFAKDGNAAVEQVPDDGTFSLEAGDYILTVNAYIDTVAEANLAAQGTSASFTVEAEADAGTVEVILLPIPIVSEDVGTLKYTLTFPDETTVTDLTLTRLVGDGDPINLMAESSVTSATEYTATVGVGYWLLTARLAKVGGDVAGVTEVVHIYKNLETAASYTFTADEFYLPLSGAVTITGGTSADGAPQTGDTLTANIDSSTNGIGTPSYQWKRDGTTNIGTNARTYTVSNNDADHTITVSVMYSGNSGSVTSDPTAKVGIKLPIKSADVLALYVAHLGTLDANTAATPYTVPLALAFDTAGATQGEQISWVAINTALAGLIRYVTLDLSASTAAHQMTANTIAGTASSSPSGSSFNIIKGNAYIKGVILPDTLTSIGSNAFYGCSGITSVIIPSRVASIGEAAFRSCSGLINVTIPDSVESIGASAFYGCTSLSSVTIGEGVTSIGNFAFQNCADLTSVNIPGRVTSIGASAFAACNDLTAFTVAESNTAYSAQDGILYNKAKTTIVSVPRKINGELNLPNTLTSIGSYAFQNCVGITSATIPDTVDSIGSYAFQNCSGLISVTIPGNDTTSIGDYAFDGCSDLTSVTIGEGVTSIGTSAFQNCGDLTSLTIAEGVINIGTSAFRGCVGLTSVTIPDSVTNIRTYAFYGCSGLISVTIPGGASIWDDVFSGGGDITSVTITGNTVNSTVGQAFSDSSALSVTIAEGVTSIGANAFQNCGVLSGVSIPDTVISIGDYAFDGCGDLISMTIGEGVESIGDYAFRNCVGLISVSIPDSVDSIGARAFYGCGSLSSVNIGEGVTSIGTYAFDSVLTAFTVAEGNTVYSAQNGILYNKAKTTIVSVPREISGALTLPNTLTSIGSSAFSGRVGLTSVIIPNSVISIGSNAFYGCGGLTSATIGEGVESIGNYAFQNCGDLTSVTIGGAVTSIGYAVFQDCTSLSSVTIPSSVTSILSGAFHGCTSLTAFTVAASNTAYSAQDGILYNKTKTTVISVPGAKSGALTLPNTLTSIGAGAFGGCASLTSVTIPGSVTSIELQAFIYCSALTTVIFGAGSNITTVWSDSTFSTSSSTYSGTSLWTAYTTGSKPGTYTRSGSTWTQVQ